tara:strand:+ start:236 stop:712 length:477 start_codon:yes stop_codon:yes gene_type:complete
MEKEFVTIDLALRLKALGFDEPCFAGFNPTPFDYDDLKNLIYPTIKLEFDGEDVVYNDFQTEEPNIWTIDSDVILAPTFSQAFKFFREKYMIGHDIMCPFISYQGKNAEIISEGRYEVFLTDEEQMGITDEEFYSMTYNEAEIKCLNLLLRIVESKSK